MAISVLLTVDLNRGVSEQARARFNEKMAEQNWNRISLTTAWTGVFGEGNSASQALTVAKNNVATAANAAGIGNYEFAAQAGAQPVEVQRIGR